MTETPEVGRTGPVRGRSAGPRPRAPQRRDLLPVRLPGPVGLHLAADHRARRRAAGGHRQPRHVPHRRRRALLGRRMGDGVRHELSRGDVVVMPYGDAHSWGSFEDAEPVSIAILLPPDRGRSCRTSTTAATAPRRRSCAATCAGTPCCSTRSCAPCRRCSWCGRTARPRPGSTASVEYAMTNPSTALADGPGPGQRLAESLFTEVLRLYLQERRDADLTGWLAALRDPIVGQALSLLHADPAHAWTVGELARSGGSVADGAGRRLRPAARAGRRSAISRNGASTSRRACCGRPTPGWGRSPGPSATRRRRRSAVPSSEPSVRRRHAGEPNAADGRY